MAVRIERQAEPIPGYKLIDRLGGGGFGEVWRCEAPGGLHKAIKFVFGDLKAAGDKGHRAEQELKALSRVKTVRHPYILSLERYDIIDGQLLIVMELADRNLWDRYKECRVQGLPGIPRAELLGYMKETAEALDLMNSQYQLQHLDIKPQNLFLVHSHVKVADFGLVKDLEGMQASVTGGVTPVYAAPETFDGWVSRYSDQYSLAIVYQELLTGVRPFAGTNVRQLIFQHLQATPNVSPLPLVEQPAIARSLSKDPNQRYPTCSELVEALVATTMTAPAATPIAPLPAVAPSSLLSVTQEQEGPPSNPPESAPTSSIRVRTTDSQQGINPVPQVADSLSGSASSLKTTRQAVAQESQGDGTLFPALVLSVGGLGTTILRHFRECLYARFGSLEPLTNLRLLALDTDPDAAKATTRGTPATALPLNDVFVAQLNRPSYYVKPRDGKPAIETWLNPRMLFRIPRNQVTGGVRALGRLAYCDHYRAIVRRLQNDLEGLLAPEALAAAAEQTGLGQRTNRPRIYIIAGLCGGTGSGIFLDLAYTARALLLQAGYTHPDVVGLLLVPAVDRNCPPSVGLGNAYAALTELNYFGASTNRFTARYHDHEKALADTNPPFSRCILLALPNEGDAIAVRELMEAAGQYLAHDLCSPIGRTTDLGRAELSCPPWELRGQFYQTFGLFRMHWPRAARLRAVAGRLCRQLVQRWMSKDGKSLQEAVREWVQDQWTVHDLKIEQFITQLQTAAAKSLGKSAEAVVTEVVTPIAQGLEERTRAARRGSPPAEIPLEEMYDALKQFAELLGKPTDEAITAVTGSLAILLRETAEQLAHVWGQKLVELPICLIEDPHYRLAGAEEAVRHIVATLEQALQHHEPLTRDLAERTAEAYARLRALITPPKPGSKRYTLPAADILELLRCYPKWRYQSLVMQQVASAFVGMRGHLSDELREINYCRARLGELGRTFEPVPADAPPGNGATDTPTGRCLFPLGCRDLDECVEQFLAAITPHELSVLDDQVQAMLTERFTALVHICLSRANQLKTVHAAMLETAEAFAAARLPGTDVAQMFFEKYTDEEHTLAEMEGFYGEASPELAPRRGMKSIELCVLATPPGPDGDRFRELAREALPKVEFQGAPSGDDVLLYRELSYLPLQELEQLGPAGQEAYRQMTKMEHFTPHSRCDITFVPES